MNVYTGSPLVWVLLILFVFGTIYAVRAAIAYRAVALDAAADYSYRQTHAMIPKGLSEDAFLRIYRRVNNPRHLLFMAIGIFAVLIATPIVFVLIEAILEFFYNNSGQSRVIEPGFLVWQFLLFVMTIGSWAGIGYITAGIYHRGAPGNLEMEISNALNSDL